MTQYGEPVLREKGEAVDRFDDELRRLADDMIQTMYAEEGIGLAAQQVDRALQVCIVDVRPPEGGDVPFAYRLDGRQPPLDLIMPMVLVNPQVEAGGAETDLAEEGCLSFPDIRGRIERPSAIRCSFQDLNGNPHIIEANGLLGRCIQHEVDHLNGVLFIDRMDKADLERAGPRLRKLKRASRDRLKARTSAG